MKKVIAFLTAFIGLYMSGISQSAPVPVKKREDKMKTVPVKQVIPAKVFPIAKTVRARAAEVKLKTAASAPAVVLRKDGTPDRRYKSTDAAKGRLKQEGTPDKRFKGNKKGR